MGYGCASVVEWGFVIPREKLYPLLRILRELAGKQGDSSDPEAETSKATEEAQEPPAKKRKLRKISDDDLDELLELMDAAMRKADDERAEKEEAEKEKADKEKENNGEADKGKADKESLEDVEPYLQEIIKMTRTSDKKAGDTIACYYSLGNGDKARYMVEQWGHIEEYELQSVCMGKTLSLKGLIKEVAEGMGHSLREALRFKEAGIKVEDQWILMLVPM